MTNNFVKSDTPCSCDTRGMSRFFGILTLVIGISGYIIGYSIGKMNLAYDISTGAATVNVVTNTITKSLVTVNYHN